MQIFTGEYNHTLDAKGRLIIPSKFRELLGDKFMVTKGMDGCLFVFTYAEWENLFQKIYDMKMMDKKSRIFSRYFLSGAVEVEVDKQGRILIPAVLRSFAGIEKDAVLIGVGNRVEIWSKENWEGNVSYQDIDEISQYMFDMGMGI